MLTTLRRNARLRSVMSEITPLMSELSDLQLGKLYEHRGVVFTLESAPGDMRPKYLANGTKVMCPVQSYYGDIPNTTGADGDPIDVYIAPPDVFTDSDQVVILNQKDPNTGEFDEHKLFIGYPDADTLKSMYCAGYPGDSGKDRIGGLSSVSYETALDWMSRPATSSYGDAELEGSTESFTGDASLPAEPSDGCQDEADDLSFGEREIQICRLGQAPVMTISRHPANPGGYVFDVYLYSAFEDTQWGGAADDITRRLNYATVKDAFVFHIVSPGGEVDLAARIASSIRTTKARVVTVAEGMVASAGCLLWCEGHVRCVTPGAVIMQHMSSHGAMGHTGQIEQQAAQLRSYINSVVLTRAKSIGLLTEDEVDSLSRRARDIYLTADVVVERTGAELITNGK